MSGDNDWAREFGGPSRNVSHENGHIDLALDPTKTMPAFERAKIFRPNPGSGLPLVSQQHSCELDLTFKENKGKTIDDPSLGCYLSGEIYADLYLAYLYDEWNENPKYADLVDDAKKWIEERLRERTRRIIAEQGLGGDKDE